MIYLMSKTRAQDTGQNLLIEVIAEIFFTSKYIRIPAKTRENNFLQPEYDHMITDH